MTVPEVWSKIEQVRSNGLYRSDGCAALKKGFLIYKRIHYEEMEYDLKKNKYEIDMVNGSIMDKLVSFSLPLMATSILQLMFNAVDIIVVGHFSGSDALAAVGATTALINIFTNLFIGISMGANVLCARYYAAGHDEEMSESVHTAITLALLSGVLMAVVGFAAAGWALGLMDTPPDVIGLSTLYMKIYFSACRFLCSIITARPYCAPWEIRNVRYFSCVLPVLPMWCSTSFWSS